jgi:hypothetical protein
MPVVSITTGKNAKGTGESQLSKNESRLQTNFSVMQAVLSFCKRKQLKPVKEIRHATRASDRMIQYWIENKYSIATDDLANLLRSDAGFAILENIIGDAKPIWWRDFKRGVKRAELRRQQKALQEAIEENEQGDLGL